MQTNPELERAIAEDPDDVHAWSVYADWLQGQGEVWGEWLSLNLANARAPDPKMAEAIVAMYEREREALLGPALAELSRQTGFAEVAGLEWRHGCIVGARVAAPDYDWTEPTSVEVLAALLANPMARCLRSLTIGLSNFEGQGLTDSVEAIGNAGELASLRELFIGDFEYPDQQEISWVDVGEVGPLLANLPRLRSLHLRGASIGLGAALEHATLERLVIETGGLPAEAVQAIARCRLPRLRELGVWFGMDGYGAGGNIELLAPLFTGEGLPALEVLGLMNSEFTNDIVRELARSPLLARVREVDLSMGSLHDEGGQVILAAAESFRHLARLDLDHNFLSTETAMAIERVFGSKVTLGERCEPWVYQGRTRYYAQIGE
ncbi:TIGR02996 domain-containing protein [Nannocystaceae bacterium ST9]